MNTTITQKRSSETTTISFERNVCQKTENPGLTCRKNILVLATTHDWDKGELDRYMIALYRYQTEGRVAYRRIMGMHGGGGGWKGGVVKDKDGNDVMDKKGEPLTYEGLLLAKARADADQGHYDTSTPFTWPDTSPNNALPEQQKFLQSPYTYTFCWHVEPQFLLWHRALMIEMELGLQDYDVEQPDNFDPNDPNRFHNKLKGSKALGAHYWAWETWDGMGLPLLFTSPTYVIRSNKYGLKGYPSGRIIPNPLYRWYAPVSLEDQKAEKFPGNLDSYNCTTRNPCFTDLSITPKNNNIWPLQKVTIPGKKDPKTHKEQIDPPMTESVRIALNHKEFLLFATTKYGIQYSIEESHNLLHNHVGGNTLDSLHRCTRQKISFGNYYHL